MTTPTLTYSPPTASALQQLRHSPQLPLALQALQTLLEAEQERRVRFYDKVSEDQKAEFINGEVIVQSPAKLQHTIASQNLFILLNLYVSAHNLGYVGHEKVLIALTRNDYEPDIVYFRPEKAQIFAAAQMKFPAPDLVVEVLSPSTASYDRGIKFEDYAAHHIEEYWMIDPDAGIVEQYVLQDEGYHLHIKTNTGTISSVVIPGFTIPVRAIFDEEEKLAAVQAMLAGGE